MALNFCFGHCQIFLVRQRVSDMVGLCGDIVKHHIGTVFGQGFGTGQTDASGTAGHQGGFAFELECPFRSMVRSFGRNGCGSGQAEAGSSGKKVAAAGQRGFGRFIRHGRISIG